MTKTALRVYTVVAALVCALAVAYALQQERLTAASRSQMVAWQTLAKQMVAHDKAVTREAKLLTVRYNALVRDTGRSQRKLIAALRQARSAALHSASAAPASVSAYTTVASSGPAPAPAPVPVAAPAPAAPTTTSSAHP
ncbi:MAG TPA: hypothetical protein VMU66_07350 [Gaiellales bacterium]|nr:hypothetical protein [Gaiellales bacterium]